MISYVFPNGTGPIAGQSKTIVPTVGKIAITIYARNVAQFLKGAKASFVFRNEVRGEPVTPTTQWISVSSTTMSVPHNASRGDTDSTIVTNTTDGIRYQTVSTVTSRGSGPATNDTLRVDVYREIYNIQWPLPAGEGKLQPLKLMVTFQGINYYSNEVTIDYESPQLDRVVTMQYVLWLLISRLRCGCCVVSLSV